MNSFNIPVGVIISHSAVLPPTATNLLLCDGKRYNKTQYSDLFNVIGNTYGGNGTTHFRVPNLNLADISGAGVGLMPGDGAMDISGALGDISGNIDISLNEAQLVGHTHEIGSLSLSHTHSIPGDDPGTYWKSPYIPNSVPKPGGDNQSSGSSYLKSQGPTFLNKTLTVLRQEGYINISNNPSNNNITGDLDISGSGMSFNIQPYSINMRYYIIAS